MANRVKLLIVDIDGTLLPTSMERVFFSYLRQKRITGWMRTAWNALVILITAGLPRWQNFKVAYLRGLTSEVVESAAVECYSAHIQPLLYSALLRALQELQNKGVELAIVSGTLNILARQLAESCGISCVAAAEPQVVDGRYSGGMVEPHPYGQRKINAALRILEARSLDWGDAGAIADSYHDRYLLNAVWKRVIVRPEGRIAKLARNKGWKTLDQIDDSAHISQILGNEFPVL